MRVYLDTSVYGRPFDDQNQRRIQQEAEAFVDIFAEVVKGTMTLIGSDILKLEVRRNPEALERERIGAYLAYCAEMVSQSEEVLKLARELREITMGVRDAIHLASAVIGNAQYFLTCDDQVARKASLIQEVLGKRGFKVDVLNPVMFLSLFKSRGGETL